METIKMSMIKTYRLFCLPVSTVKGQQTRQSDDVISCQQSFSCLVSTLLSSEPHLDLFHPVKLK